ncbi:FeoB-associated Cys-rich membrane protein [bacterium]|nr:FeoB-associated Cys-rich membrane protein [bacterium]
MVEYIIIGIIVFLAVVWVIRIVYKRTKKPLNSSHKPCENCDGSCGLKKD